MCIDCSPLSCRLADDSSVVCEISPLVSYCGEVSHTHNHTLFHTPLSLQGLEKLVAGKSFAAPVHLEAKN